jgi:DNA-binding MarR family transcriptional regulator
MPAERLTMRKVKEILRLYWGTGLSQRQIAISCGISRPTVTEYIRRAEAAGLSWPLPVEMDEAQLEQRLFPRVTAIWQIHVNLHAKELASANQVPIEHIFAVKDDIVPLDRADMLKQ